MASEYANLLPVSGNWKQKITEYLTEDVPSFDFGGFVVGNTPETGSLYMKQSGVICGIPFINEVFHQCNLQHKWNFSEGQYISENEISNAGGKIVVCKVKRISFKYFIS